MRGAGRLKPSEAPITIVRYADPFSWQSWCLEPVVRRLEEVWGGNLRVECRMGGLFDSIQDWLKGARLNQDTVIRTIREAGAAAGMPLYADYLWRCGVKSTWAGCVAYKAAELQNPSLAPHYFRRMMEAFLIEGRPASSDEYIRLGGEVGLITARLRLDTEIPLAKERFDEDRREMSSTAGASYDSLLISSSGSERRVDGIASKPYEDAIRAMAPEVPTVRPSDLGEYAERRGSLLPAREIAEVFQIPDSFAADRLTALASGGLLERVVLEPGMFWRWKGPSPDRLPLTVSLASYIPTVIPSDMNLASIVVAAVRARFANVAVRPSDPQPFPIGSEAAARLNYPRDILEAVPSAAVESFSGVGNVFIGTPIEKNDVVFDIGCGSGTDAFLALARLGRRGKVSGFDITPAMIAKARACVAKRGDKRITIQEGKATSIPESEGSADVVLSNGVLHLVQNKAAVLREILRVLRPGGVVKLASVVLRNRLPDPLGSDSDLWADGLAGAPLEKGLPRALEAAGFAGVRVASQHDYYAQSKFPAVYRIARGVGAQSLVIEASKPEARKRRR